MKFRPRRLLPSCAGTAILAAASLALPACTETGYVGDGATPSDNSYYRATGRYQHCHPEGVCHDSRHPNFYHHGGYYVPRRPYHYHGAPSFSNQPPHQYYRPDPPPARARPR